MALPGVRTVINDRFYSLSRTDIPVGPRVVAIARRDTPDGTENVSDYDPYPATSERRVVAAFGEGSELHRAYLELTSGGASRIYLVALPGDLTDADIVTDDVLDQAFDAAELARPDIIVPWGRGGHPSDWDEGDATPSLSKIGFYANNESIPSESLPYKVAQRCKNISERSNPVFGILGIAPFSNGSSTSNMTVANMNEHFDIATPATPTAENNTLATLTDRESHDNAAGMYVSVIATELRPLGYPAEFGFSNGACMYAGSISQMNSWTSPTNKTVFNVAELRYSPTRGMQEELISRGVVPVALDYNRVPIWVDAQTFGKAASDYTRLSTLRIVLQTISMVRNVAQIYVGEAATVENRNAFETAISSSLRQMQILGALITSDYIVTYLPRENKAVVDLVLNPAFEMRTIEIAVSVQL